MCRKPHPACSLKVFAKHEFPARLPTDAVSQNFQYFFANDGNTVLKAGPWIDMSVLCSHLKEFRNLLL